MTFSWDKIKAKAIEHKIRRAKTMARVSNNDDFRIEHPQWIKDAQVKKYTELEIKIRDKVLRYQGKAIKRRDKLAGK